MLAKSGNIPEDARVALDNNPLDASAEGPEILDALVSEELALIGFIRIVAPALYQLSD